MSALNIRRGLLAFAALALILLPAALALATLIAPSLVLTISPSLLWSLEAASRYPDAIGAVHGHYDADYIVDPRLLRRLPAEPSDAARRLVRGRLQSPRPEMRRLCVLLLPRAEPRACSDLIIAGHLLADPDRRVRDLSAWVLGEARSPEAVEALTAAAADADEDVAISAVRALGKIGGPTARLRLVEIRRQSTGALRPRRISR